LDPSYPTFWEKKREKIKLKNSYSKRYNLDFLFI
jgi:hypothetical protein